MDDGIKIIDDATFNLAGYKESESSTNTSRVGLNVGASCKIHIADHLPQSGIQSGLPAGIPEG